MHPSAYEIGRLLFKTYWRNEYRRILDIGSRDVNGTLRDFCPEGAEYVGVDIAEGKGVDVVLKDPYSFPFADGSFDLIISSSCFEHDRMFWLTFLEACRVLSQQGALYINAPSNGGYHSYPYDNWRFYPDAGLALEEWAQRSEQNARLIESFIASRTGPAEGESYWSDCVMIFGKGNPSSPRTTGFLSDLFSATSLVKPMNVRRFDGPEVRNFSADNQDMIEIRALQAQVKKLRASYEHLSSECAAMLATRYPALICAGRVDAVRDDVGGRTLEGWAADATARCPARFVVLMVEGQPAASAPVCLPRADVARELKMDDNRLGFAIPLSERLGEIGPDRCKLLAFSSAYLGELAWRAGWSKNP